MELKELLLHNLIWFAWYDLHGFSTHPGHQKQLRAVATLKNIVSQIRSLKKGTPIGYDGSTVLKRDSIIAAIAIGYADGLNRLLSNENGTVVIGNKKAPILGKICMDMALSM